MPQLMTCRAQIGLKERSGEEDNGRDSDVDPAGFAGGDDDDGKPVKGTCSQHHSCQSLMQRAAGVGGASRRARRKMRRAG